MKLKTVEIVGFKSFRDRVVVEISDGMTCIVGPNGCGKSNVVDAIKWAMGDMSPKSLRGSSMSDVIFAGTEKAKAAGMAEVTLTFENPDAVDARQRELDEASVETGEDAESQSEAAEEESDSTQGFNAMGRSIPREYRDLPEISLTRRLHRSGKSEYLINKTDCRLRDIQNLLAGTGLGKQGYSIIEQGQIGFIVNARPSERRLIIEEASGITRYKDKRKRAARKLEKTEQNLQRTQDILDEIEKRMSSLEKQAERAREHRELSGELENLEVALLLDRRSEASEKAKVLKDKVEGAQKRVSKRKASLEEAEKNLVVMRKKGSEAERRHADLTENVYKVETRLNLARSNRKHALEGIEEAKTRLEELDEERHRQKERRAHLKEELARAKKALEEVEDNPEEVDSGIDELEARLDAMRQKRKKKATLRERWRREVESAEAERQRSGDRVEWIVDQLEEIQIRRDTLEAEEEEVQEDLEDLDRSINRLMVDEERGQQAIAEARRAAERWESKVEGRREELEDARRQEAELARRMLRLEARRDSLEQMRARGEGYAEGVQRVLEWAGDEEVEGVLGPAGDFLSVPEGQEAAYAAYLGDRLQDIVVADEDVAFEAVKLLKEEEAGRVGCLVMGEEGDPRAHLEAWLEGLVVVDDLETVQEEEAPEYVAAWATAEGDIRYRGGRLVGGSQGEQGEVGLRQARELEELKEELQGLKEAHQEAVDTVDLGEEELQIAEETLETRREELQEAVHRTRGAKQELEGERREKKRARQRRKKVEAALQELDEQVEQWQEEVERLREQRQTLAGELPQKRQQWEKAKELVSGLDEAIAALSEELTEQRVEVAQIDERRRHLKANIARFQEGIGDAEKQLERLANEKEEQQTKKKDGAMRAETLAKEVDRLGNDHEQLKKEVGEAKEVLDEIGEKIQGLELAVLGHRQDVEEATQQVQALTMEMREAELSVEHVTEQLGEQYELTLEEARRQSLLVETPAEKRKGRAQYLKQRLRKLGEVNPLAIEEFEETKERYAFHQEQQTDLEESVADLRDAIERMDWESRKRFRETFDAINDKFQEVFPRLFQGGSARMVLTEPEDILETGVDIEVQPPGKKLQNVSLLSGGEKALTAVSLIFSIFLLKPSPFAVLDEVDAPLDDANVGRFAEMVRRLSADSQMIVITHNRTTMEAPERLYGVTMEEAGVSKMVSVKLSEVDDRLAG